MQISKDVNRINFSETFTSKSPSNLNRIESECEKIQSLRLGRGRSIVARQSFHHHHLELVEIDGAAAVDVDAADHPLAVVEGALLAEAPEHVEQLLRRDRAVLIGVEHLEGVPQVLQHLVVVDVAGVELDELAEVDEAVAVGVDLADHADKLLLRHRVAEAPHDRAELRRADLAVAVGVELAENLLQFLLDPAAAVLRSREGAHDEGLGGGVDRSLGLLLLLEERSESH